MNSGQSRLPRPIHPLYHPVYDERAAYSHSAAGDMLEALVCKPLKWGPATWASNGPGDSSAAFHSPAERLDVPGAIANMPR